MTLERHASYYIAYSFHMEFKSEVENTTEIFSLRISRKAESMESWMILTKNSCAFEGPSPIYTETTWLEESAEERIKEKKNLYLENGHIKGFYSLLTLLKVLVDKEEFIALGIRTKPSHNYQLLCCLMMAVRLRSRSMIHSRKQSWSVYLSASYNEHPPLNFIKSRNQ